MSWGEALFLGILQGIGEFLPISSSSHLVLAQRLLGIDSPKVAVGALHLATALGVAIVLRNTLWRLFTDRRRELALLLVACLPAPAAYLMFQKVGEQPIEATAAAWIATALILAWGRSGREGTSSLHDWPISRALAVGVAQGMAVFPGISRSGVTLSCGNRLGLAPTEAVRFSLLLSLPISVGRGTLELWQAESIDPPLYAACGVAFALSFPGVRILYWIGERRRFFPFSCYLFALGVIVLIRSLLG